MNIQMDNLTIQEYNVQDQLDKLSVSQNKSQL